MATADNAASAVHPSSLSLAATVCWQLVARHCSAAGVDARVTVENEDLTAPRHVRRNEVRARGGGTQPPEWQVETYPEEDADDPIGEVAPEDAPFVWLVWIVGVGHELLDHGAWGVVLWKEEQE